LGAVIAAVLLACIVAATWAPAVLASGPPQCPNGTDGNGNSACIVPNGTTIQQYTIGNYSGITEVDSGGKVQVGTANSETGQLNGGDTATNNGTVQLEGPTSFPTVINNSSWQIGSGGSTAVGGTLTNNGTYQLTDSASTSAGTLNNGGSYQLTNSASTTVSGNLTNSGSYQLTNSATTSVSGTLTNNNMFQIANGATTSAGVVQIGTVAGTQSLQVANGTGSGSSLTVTGVIGVGEANGAMATFQVGQGAAATSSTGVIGDVTGSTGTANIDGAGTTWTLSNHLSVGNFGTGTLTITNGATVSDANQAFNNATTCIGCGANSTGTITVSGSTTSTPGTATLSIQGFNQNISDHANIFVGQSGTGTLTVANGGIVTVGGGTGTIEVAVNSGSTGTLALAQTAGQNAPTVNASTIQFGSGTGTLAFNVDPSTPYTFSPTIAGAGTVAVAGGVIVFTGKTETYTGPTSVSSGATLKLTGGTSIVASQGVLASGTFDISGNGNTSIKSLAGTGGQVNLGANTLTVTGSGSFTGTLGAPGDTGGFTVDSTSTQQTLTTVTGNYTGATTINAGDILVLSTGTNISASSGVIDNGKLDISGNGNTSVKTLTGTGGIVSLGANTLTVTAASGTFSGTLGAQNDTGAFTVASGTQILDAVTGPYSGPTTIATGANLTLINASRIPLSGVVDNGTFDISNNGATAVTSLTGTNGQVNLGANTLQVSAGTGTFSGALGAAGDTGGFALSGGTQTFSAVTGNYTGATSIGTGATLALTNATNLVASSGIVDNGTFSISGNGNTSVTRLTGTGGQVNLGANTLTVLSTGSFSGTLGALGDTGGFTVAGSATQMVFSAVTGRYSGATTINAGDTLSLTNGSKISTSNNVIDNGTFAIASNGNNTTITSLSGTNPAATVALGANTLTLSNASGTFAGALSGATGGLTLTAGTETLTGQNNYMGMTSINGGTLVAGAVDTFAPFSGVRIGSSSGSLDLNNFDQTIGSLSGFGPVTLGTATLTTGGNDLDTTYSGRMSGDGGVVKTGTGAFVLTNNNSYTGGTVLSEGMLVVANNHALGSGPLSMAAGTTLAFLSNNNFTVANNITISGDPTFSAPSGTSQTISGVIADGSAPGTLVVSGGGTLLLSAINTYTGPTIVNSGTLDVTGSIATSSVTVNNGSTLSGTGTVGTTQINSGGNFAPGTGAPGTSMPVLGSLAFQSGAVYMVQLNPSTTSFASVTGTASLNGTVSATFASGNYVVTQYTILQSAGLNHTRFSGVTTTNEPANLTAVLTYTPNDAYLNLLASQGLINPNNKYTNNQASVAQALNDYLFSGGALTPNVALLYSLTGSNLTTALTQLSGEVATGAERGAFQIMDQFLNLMLDPFVNGRLGSGSGEGGGQAIGFAPDAQTILPADVALAYAGALQAPPPARFEQRWTAWGAGFGGANATNGNAAVGSNNLTAQTYGYAGGMDYHFSPDTIFGFALGGGGTNWGLASNLGTGRSDAFQSGVYGITRAGPAYLAGAFAFTNHWMTTSRTAVGDSLSASFDAQSYGGRLEAGYGYGVLPTLGFTPYAAVQAQEFHTPSYSESDLTGGGYGLSYSAMDATDVRSELGARFDNPTVVGGMPLFIRARAAWAHDWVSNPALDAVFETLPGGSFVVNGAPIPQNSALTSVGAELFLAPSVALLFKFDGEFAPGSHTYAGSGTLRYAW
jgi:autotransporter-associated beta strand protein